MSLPPIFFNKPPVLLALACCLTLATACNDDDAESKPDTTRPVITVTTPASTETAAEVGNTLNLIGSISDDRGLSQLRIDIHNAFDGHIHKTAALTAWSLDTIINLSDRNFNFNLAFRVPDSTLTGPYDIILKALDAAGNEAAFVEIDLTINSPNAPVFSNMLVDSMTVAEAEVIHVHFSDFPTADSLPKRLMGTVTDNMALDEVYILLMPKTDLTPGDGNPIRPVYKLEYDNLSGQNNLNFNTLLPFRRTDFPVGETHLHLLIKAKDAQGNLSMWKRYVHVKR